MDKELLRIVIILTGMLVMIGMLLWHFFMSMQQRRESGYFEESPYDGRADDFKAEARENDEFANFQLDSIVDGDALLDDVAMKPTPKASASNPAQPEAGKSAVSRYKLPKLIEFSIVARADQGFNGEELFEAFDNAGLKFGSVKVFERIDKNRMVDFAVASMIDPGTFPETGIENFYCPGIVFFMQPREVDQPLAVFEDFIETIDILAEDLDGVVWDNQRQPLTAETIAQFRQMLAQK